MIYREWEVKLMPYRGGKSETLAIFPDYMYDEAVYYAACWHAPSAYVREAVWEFDCDSTK